MKYAYKNGIKLQQIFLGDFVSLELLAEIFWGVCSQI